MKRIHLPHEDGVEGLQFSQADNRALMELLIGVTTNQITDADRTFAKLLMLRYCYFLSELERAPKPQTKQQSEPASKTPRPDLRPAPMLHRKKKGRR